MITLGVLERPKLFRPNPQAGRERACACPARRNRSPVRPARLRQGAEKGIGPHSSRWQGGGERQQQAALHANSDETNRSIAEALLWKEVLSPDMIT